MRLRGPKILVRRYVKPERIGSIFVPEPWRTEGSRSLWEVVESTSAADSLLKISLLPNWILVTARNSGVFLERRDGVDIFILAATSVVRVIPWTSEENVNVKGKRIVVAPDPEKVRTGAIIMAPGPAWERRPVTGVITEVGDGITDPDLAVGVRVLYGIHAGSEMTINGQKRLILQGQDERTVDGTWVFGQVLAVLEDSEEVSAA